ncbi:MAG TPA: hypothetical protein VJ971_04785 [Methylomirabilota bacterium]|jgi:hypothetical protein|nr:hypothetical protein [Methylomirabilota bacterium]
MIAKLRIVALGLALLGGVVADGPAAEPAQPTRGACYCRMADMLRCTANLTEPECRHRCDEALCDDWFWKERLPCWNWGYGG